MYASGEDVPQDYVEALAWYRRAAEQGHASAQFGLGVMYANGEGVPQDNVEAHMWLNLAASRSSGEQRERTVTTRDAVAERMTPADLGEAQRRAREWYAAHPVPWQRCRQRFTWSRSMKVASNKIQRTGRNSVSCVR